MEQEKEMEELDERKKPTKFIKLIKRFFNIFYKAMIYKFFLLCLKKRLNIVKIIKEYKSIFKTAFGISMISNFFWLMRYYFHHLRSIGMFKNYLNNNKEFENSWLNFEYFLSGCAASIAVTLLDSTDKNLVKLLLYMRAIHAGFFLIKYKIDSIVN